MDTILKSVGTGNKQMKNSLRCLCKKVELIVQIKDLQFDSCHCSMCRSWCGGPALAVQANKLKIINNEHVTIYNSSEWAERGFCNQCGTHLFYRLKDGSFINVPLGLFDNADDFKFNSQIFIDKKPKCYSFSDVTKLMTEEEILNLYSGK